MKWTIIAPPPILAVIPDFSPIIPAKAGIQRNANTVGNVRARYVNMP